MGDNVKLLDYAAPDTAFKCVHMNARDRARELYLGSYGTPTDMINAIEAAIVEAEETARANERKACIKVADDLARGYHQGQDDCGVNWQIAVAQKDVALCIADAIRARGAK